MESLETLVKRHLNEFPDFQYYGAFAEFISVIESYHKTLHVGISVDCCNSLVHSICKTIITQITKKKASDLDSREYNNADKIIKEAVKLIQKNDDIYERNLTSQLAKIGQHIYDLRRARGEISHGRSIPKELIDDQDLSRLLKEITESLARYLISSFFSFALEKQSKEDFEIKESRIRYEENPEFNDLLDEEYPYEGKLLYSQALYTLYYEDYEIQLQTFLDEQAMLNEE